MPLIKHYNMRDKLPEITHQHESDEHKLLLDLRKILSDQIVSDMILNPDPWFIEHLLNCGFKIIDNQLYDINNDLVQLDLDHG